MLKLYSNTQEIEFKTTMFPDKTSQVWQLGGTDGLDLSNLRVLWLFEGEHELSQLLQLVYLLRSLYGSRIELHAPYLPYARQDKPVSNTSTWALHLLQKLIREAGIEKVRVFDQHSPCFFESESAESFHKSVINHDLICFPDKGARQRYPHLQGSPHGSRYVWCEKVRDQLTGAITGLTLHAMGHQLRGARVCIVDDLCDGGRTFIEVAAKLREAQVAAIDLVVSHGLFSQGKDVLHEAGIGTIYTTNSLLHNADGYKVW
jgi:ribose-phosphate pyrophosphokinase